MSKRHKVFYLQTPHHFQLFQQKMTNFFREIDQLIKKNDTSKALQFLRGELEAQSEIFGKEPSSEEVADIYEKIGLIYDLQRKTD